MRLAVLSMLLALLAGIGRVGRSTALIHSERSLYRQVFVYENALFDALPVLYALVRASAGRSCIDLKQPERLVFEYTQMMLGALLLNPDPHSILIIGLGGGTLPRTLEKLLPNADIDVVEIDPAVVRVAQQYFGFQTDAHLHVYRTRTAGRTCGGCFAGSKRYQLIMLDAYEQPVHSRAHADAGISDARCARCWQPDGIVAANTFSSSRLYQNESVTYRAVFGEFYNLKSANRVILASNGPLPSIDEATRNAEHFDAARSARTGFQSESVLALFQHRRRLGSRTHVC